MNKVRMPLKKADYDEMIQWAVNRTDKVSYVSSDMILGRTKYRIKGYLNYRNSNLEIITEFSKIGANGKLTLIKKEVHPIPSMVTKKFSGRRKMSNAEQHIAYESLAGRRMSSSQIMVERWGIEPADVPRLKRLSKELSLWFVMDANGEIEAAGNYEDSWESPNLKFYYNRKANNEGKPMNRFGSGGNHPLDYFIVIPNGLRKTVEKFYKFQKKYPFLVLQTDPRGCPIYFGKHDWGEFCI